MLLFIVHSFIANSELAMIKPMFLEVEFFSFISLTLYQLFLVSICSLNFNGIQCTEALRTSAMDHLQVSQKGLFKIALFADLHFGEAEALNWGPQQDVNSTRVMSHILDQEHPDFVVYLGDVITANNMPMHNASLYWDQAVSPTRTRGIPWASVFGNHDDAPFEWPIEWFSSAGIPNIVCPAADNSCSGDIRCGFKGTTRLELMTAESERNPLSCSEIGPKQLWPGVSNYVLKISSSRNSRDAAAYMYFLDSGGGSYPEVVSSAQSEWFRSTSHEVNPDSRVPEIIFWHIPSKVYKKLGKKKCVGSLFEEEVAPQIAEMGIMKLLEERPSVKAVFVGHNHGLDWCCPYKKLWLCFARHTGYGGYGDWPRGARMLEITQQPFSLKSWIRMEDGQIHSQVILAS